MSKTSVADFARITAKNLAEYHGRLMEQPDATRAMVDEAVRKAIKEIERQTFERIADLRGHYCHDWDGMWVTRSMREEWNACHCAGKQSS